MLCYPAHDQTNTPAPAPPPTAPRTIVGMNQTRQQLRLNHIDRLVSPKLQADHVPQSYPLP